MKKRKSDPLDLAVAAIDRASQAQYRLNTLIERVENAILQEKEAIRAAYPLESNPPEMAQHLLHYLQQKQNSSHQWERTALDEVITVVRIDLLAMTIWPELQLAGRK